MTSRDRPSTSLIGEVIGQRFLVRERLDNTGRADVYRAEHVLIHEEVALKVAHSGMDPSEKNVARFQRVARMATQIDHPGCVKISDFGLDDRGYVYLAMEFSEGRDLRRILSEDGPRTPEEVVDIGMQMLAGLGEAHRRGILHTELAPHYVMVDLSLGTPIVKLLGFGLGQLMKGIEEGTQSRKRMSGEPARYAAPELLQPVAQIDHRADLFAVGAVLFEALTGQSAWEGADDDPLRRLDQAPRRASRVRQDGLVNMALDRALARALDPDPNRRFSDATEMSAALERAVHDDPAEVSTVASVHRQFGRYKLLRSIARGGMGELHLASSETLPGLTKVCALKRLRPELAAEKSYVDRFLAEARLAAQLSHANLATVYDVGKAEDNFYMAMEFVVGKDCRRIIDRAAEDNLKVPVPVALFIARELADALGYAHRVKLPDGNIGLIHRDVSPTNVLVSYEGLVKLIDFGLAKHATAVGKTETGVVIGKVAYMSPEQCLCDPLDHRTDIYSVGAVLYELLSGKRIREGEDLEQLASQIRQLPEQFPGDLRDDVPPEVDRVLRHALAPNPSDRYPHAEGLRDDIAQILAALEPRLSRDTVATFVKQLFPAELQSETELAQGLLTRNPPQRPDSALLEAVETGGITGGKTMAMPVVSPEEAMEIASTCFDPGPQAEPPTTAAEEPEELAKQDTLDGREGPSAASLPAAEPQAKGAGWGIALLLLVLGVGLGFALRHLVLKNLGAPPATSSHRTPEKAGGVAAVMAPMARSAMKPPVRPRPRPRPVRKGPSLEELTRQANARSFARLTKLAGAALVAKGVQVTDLPALPRVKTAYEKITGAVAQQDLGAAVDGLSGLKGLLDRKAMRCKKLRQRKYSWARRQLKAIRRVSRSQPRKQRKAFLEKLGYADLQAQLNVVRKRARNKKLTCPEQSLAYKGFLPELVKTLAKARAAAGLDAPANKKRPRPKRGMSR